MVRFRLLVESANVQPHRFKSVKNQLEWDHRRFDESNVSSYGTNSHCRLQLLFVSHSVSDDSVCRPNKGMLRLSKWLRWETSSPWENILNCSISLLAAILSFVCPSPLRSDCSLTLFAIRRVNQTSMFVSYLSLFSGELIFKEIEWMIHLGKMLLQMIQLIQRFVFDWFGLLAYYDILWMCVCLVSAKPII